MTAEQKAAYIMAQAACVNAQIAAMQAENVFRMLAGSEQAHKPEAFERLPAQFGITHNQVIEFFRS